MKLENLSIGVVQNLYLERINNFLTDERFAEYYCIDLQEAKTIIEYGAKLQETYSELYKKLVCLQNLK